MKRFAVALAVVALALFPTLAHSQYGHSVTRTRLVTPFVPSVQVHAAAFAVGGCYAAPAAVVAVPSVVLAPAVVAAPAVTVCPQVVQAQVVQAQAQVQVQQYAAPAVAVLPLAVQYAQSYAGTFAAHSSFGFHAAVVHHAVGARFGTRVVQPRAVIRQRTVIRTKIR